MATTVTRIDAAGFRLMEVGKIPSGQAVSDDVFSVGASGYILGSIGVDAAFDGTQLGFDVGFTPNGPWTPLTTDDLAEVTYTVAASKVFAVPGELFRSYPYLRVRSGTAASPVAQTGDTVVTLVFTRPV